MEVDTAYVNGMLGLDLSPADVARHLRSMQLDAQPSSSGSGVVTVRVPVVRSDVLHACDVAEDVAIAYGYNNVPVKVPATYTPGRELPLNQLTELLRLEAAMAGYTEVLTWALTSRAEAFDMMRVKDDPAGGGAVGVGNPATAEFEIARPALLPSVLKTLGANKAEELPIRLFEISDVVLLDPAASVGARNERRLAAVVCNREAGFEVIHGLLNRLMEVLGVPLGMASVAGGGADCSSGGGAGAGADAAAAAAAAGESGSGSGISYAWAPEDHPSFFPGRAAVVTVNGARVGAFGVVHPEVLEAFGVVNPVSALELNVEPFCFDQRGRSLLTRADEGCT
jgi:phenylalanyl-tRNA synthetase beta chain